jgi:hypothetical protein
MKVEKIFKNGRIGKLDLIPEDEGEAWFLARKLKFTTHCVEEDCPIISIKEDSK